MPDIDIILTQTNSGNPLFETEAAALLYRRGTPPKGINIECSAKLQCYAYPEGCQIGIWAEGIHIRVRLSDISALVASATDTLMGFAVAETKGIADREEME